MMGFWNMVFKSRKLKILKKLFKLKLKHKILELIKKKESTIWWFFYFKFFKKMIKQICKINFFNKLGFKVQNN